MRFHFSVEIFFSFDSVTSFLVSVVVLGKVLIDFLFSWTLVVVVLAMLVKLVHFFNLVELFFKKLKQNFPLSYFVGDNQNAIEIQIIFIYGKAKSKNYSWRNITY